MNNKYLIVIILSLCPYAILGQEIKVVDKSTQLPVFNVTVFSTSNNKFNVTNEKGKADITTLSDSIYFRHPAYAIRTLSKKEIAQNLFTIELEQRIIQIEEVVISANKWEQKPGEIPHQIIPINVKSTTFNNPQTAADLLEGTGKVFVQKSQMGGGSPMIRGFGANAVLIVVDGIRMNNAIFREGNLQNIINIDPNMLEGAEIITGPGSAIYGSDALGGVMDFHTKEINLYSSDKFTGASFLRFSSANREKTGHVHWTLAGEKFGWFGGISYSRYHHLRAGSNRPNKFPDVGKRNQFVERINNSDSIILNKNPNLQIQSAFNQFNTVQKLKWKLNPNLALEYLFNLSTTSNVPRYDRLAEEKDGIPINAEWYYGPQFWMMNAFKINIGPTNYWDEMKITAGAQLFKESRNDRRFKRDELRSREEKVDMVSLNLDAYKTWEFLELYYGSEFIFNEVNSNAYARNITDGTYASATTRYPVGGSDTRSFALYVNSKKRLHTSRLFLNAGLRFNIYQLHSAFRDETLPFSDINNSNEAFVGNLGLTWNPVSNFKWSILGTSGFRVPNVDDIAKVFDAEPGYVMVPNPGLKPEYSYNLETGFFWQPHKNLSMEVTAFYSQLRDAMVRTDFTFNGSDSIVYDGEWNKVQALTNTGKAIIYGFDLSVKYSLYEKWKFSAYLNMMNGEDLITNKTLRHVTPLFGITSIAYQLDQLRLEFYTRFNGAIPFEKLPPSEQNKPQFYTDDGALAWYTLNIRSAYRIKESLSINLSLENLLDKHYRTYSSGISAPGFNCIISISSDF